MFSGIKSIIFGYSEPETTIDNGAPKDDAIASDTTNDAPNGDNYDSSDIADMDDSWYVIPPPCFTGANEFNQAEVEPKPKEAARENALIEHPSIYIASTSNRDLIELKQNESISSIEEESAEEVVLAERTGFAGTKKLGKLATGSLDQPSSSDRLKKKSAANLAPLNKKSTKTRKNKFILTNWNDDRGDALIDHPSIYIASSYNSEQTEHKQKEPTRSFEKSIEINFAKKKAIVPKKVAKQVSRVVVEQPSLFERNKRKSVTNTVPLNEKKNIKTRKNKFIVRNWNDDIENALYEYPSIYDASSCCDSIGRKQEKPTQSIEHSMETNLNGVSTKKEAIVPKKVNKLTRKPADQPLSSDRNKRKSVTNLVQTNDKNSAKAWENKFIVTNWDNDDQDDLNDFDNLFDSNQPNQSSAKAKKTKAKKQQAKKQIEVKSCDLFEEMSTSLESSDFSAPASPTPALVEDEQPIETLSSPIESYVPDIDETNQEQIVAISQDKALQGKRKAPIQVRPIEPERQPSWLLKKVRSRRRPLGAILSNNTCRVSPVEKFDRPMVALRKVKTLNENPMLTSSKTVSKSNTRSPGQSPSSSARSSPTIIDRIGSSISANLSNLTSGFPAGPLPAMQQARTAMQEAERLNQSVVRKASAELNQTARRRLSKNYLDRQNDCVKLANTHRRADRRSRMHITPNGCSINRKVQTNFH